jgi:hypothetical protein
VCRQTIHRGISQDLRRPIRRASNRLVYRESLEVRQLHTRAADIFGIIDSLQKTDTGYTIPIAKYGPHDTQTATWVAHDFGAAAVALLRHHYDPVLSNSYLVVSLRFTYTELAAPIAAGACIDFCCPVDVEVHPTHISSDQGGDFHGPRDLGACRVG